MNITLRVVSATTSVNVPEEAPLIHAENGDVSTTMSSRPISEESVSFSENLSCLLVIRLPECEDTQNIETG